MSKSLQEARTRTPTPTTTAGVVNEPPSDRISLRRRANRPQDQEARAELHLHAASHLHSRSSRSHLQASRRPLDGQAGRNGNIVATATSHTQIKLRLRPRLGLNLRDGAAVLQQPGIIMMAQALAKAQPRNRMPTRSPVVCSIRSPLTNIPSSIQLRFSLTLAERHDDESNG